MSKKKKNHSKSSGNKTARKPEHSGGAAKNASSYASLPEEDYTEEYTEDYTEEYADESCGPEDAGEYYYEEEEEEYYGEDGYDAESYSEDGDGYSDGYDQSEESYDAASSDSDSIIPEFLRPFAEKCGAQFSRLERFLYNKYLLPDVNKLVSRKTTITAFSIAAAASLIIGFGLIIFLGTYPFHTTGMKTKDFIREFNAITSDTDIRAILPEYSDVTIPEKAKLGREPVYLADGHVRLTARTRFGRIIELSVEGIDIPNYDPHNYSFKTEIYEDYDTSNGQFYYYIALGKATAAAEKLLGDGLFLSERENSGASDSDSPENSGVSENSPQDVTVYEAASYGYQIYYYAFYYYVNRKNDGYVYLPMGDCYMNFTLSDMTLVIRPTIEKITTLPDGLQRFWDKLTGADGKTDDDVSVQTAQTLPAEEQQPAEGTETAASDSSLSPAA